MARNLLATFQFDSTLPGNENAPVLQFPIVEQGTLDTGEANVVLDNIAGALNTPTNGASSALTSWFSPLVSRAADSMVGKLYDITGHLDGSPHGSPIYSEAYTPDAAAGGSGMIDQVALCVTLRARDALGFPVDAPAAPPGEPNAWRPRARRSGRIFFGPLTSFDIAVGPNGEQRPGATLIGDLLKNLEGLQDSLNAIGWAWCVWSRRNEAMSVITRVECDNSFDIIRARKVAATSRTVRDFAPVPDLVLGA